MTKRQPVRTYGELSPETALALLGNDIRAEILWSLSQARNSRGPPSVLSFSDLHDEVTVDVDSSRFNYHLQQLVGAYIERVEPNTVDSTQPVSEMAKVNATGFRLRPEGTTLVRTLRAWSTEGDFECASFEVGLDCFHCKTPVTARYRNAIFAIQCPDCDYVYDYNFVPPGILKAEGEELLDRVAAYNRIQRLTFARGICPLCANGLETEIQEPAETSYPRDDLRKVIVRRGCSNCGNKDTLTLGEVMLTDTGVISCIHRHGLDLLDARLWELEFAVTDRYVTIESADPWRGSLTIPFGASTLQLEVDASVNVVERHIQ